MKRGLALGVAMAGGLTLVALVGPWLLPEPLARLPLTLATPGPGHWLGCDENGRDVATLLVLGARTALFVAVISVAISATVGGFFGLIAGYVGGRVDTALMRLSEVVASFPGILLALLMLFVMGRPGLLAVALSLSVTGWAPYARLMRGSVLVERQRLYVEAAQALGLRQLRIMLRHVAPNAVGPLVAQASAGLGGAMVAEASLSFLGFGASGVASWGQLLEQGAIYFLRTPHLAVFPALAMMWAVLGFQLLGDAARDALDPRANQ